MVILNEISDYIFSFPTFFFCPCKVVVCSKEKVKQKQHLRMTYTYGLIEAIFSIGARKKDKETRKINRSLV